MMTPLIWMTAMVIAAGLHLAQPAVLAASTYPYPRSVGAGTYRLRPLRPIPVSASAAFDELPFWSTARSLPFISRDGGGLEQVQSEPPSVRFQKLFTRTGDDDTYEGRHPRAVAAKRSEEVVSDLGGLPEEVTGSMAKRALSLWVTLHNPRTYLLRPHGTVARRYPVSSTSLESDGDNKRPVGQPLRWGR